MFRTLQTTSWPIAVSGLLLSSFALLASGLARAEAPKIGDFALGMSAATVPTVARGSGNVGTIEIQPAQRASTLYRLENDRVVELPGSDHAASQRIRWLSTRGAAKLSFTFSYAGASGQERVVGIERIDDFSPEVPLKLAPGAAIPETRPTLDGVSQKLLERYGTPSSGNALQPRNGFVTFIWSFDADGKSRKLAAGPDQAYCRQSLNIYQLPTVIAPERLIGACGSSMITAMLQLYAGDHGTTLVSNLTLVGVDVAGMAADSVRLQREIKNDLARAVDEQKKRDRQELPNKL